MLINSDLIHFLISNPCLFFSFSAHKKFKSLAPEKVGHNKNARLSMNKILQYPELRVNPFGDRICKVFSSNNGEISFEDFLDMMSVFSDAAPKSVKAEHAFRIFGWLFGNTWKDCLIYGHFFLDFDGDDMIGKNDLKQVIQRLTGYNNALSDSDIDQLITVSLDFLVSFVSFYTIF